MAVTKRNPIRRAPRVQRARAWELIAPVELKVKPDASEAFDVREKLSRLVKSFGQNTTAGLLGLDAGQMRRCLKGQEKISFTISQRIVDFEYVLDRALAVFYPDEIGPWLSQPEPLLGGAIPLNVLALRGTAPVVAALSRIAAGAFA